MSMKHRSHFTEIHEAIANRCTTWPSCACGAKGERWWTLLQEWADPDKPPATPDDIEWARIDLATMLACMAAHCHDHAQRIHATMQLMQPAFDLRTIGEADEPAGPQLRVVGGRDD
jgi:hypothetical protein